MKGTYVDIEGKELVKLPIQIVHDVKTGIKYVRCPYCKKIWELTELDQIDAISNHTIIHEVNPEELKIVD